jgi:hypothetical protein
MRERLLQYRCRTLAERRATLAAAALIAALCVAAFAPAFQAGATNWDDAAYLADPAARSVSAATFTSFVMGNWHPLTMLSFVIQRQWLGADARMLHATNVALHAVAAILVLLLLRALTGSLFAAAAGACFFAIHPLRVESVAWIAERKDVLFGVLFIAAMLAYVAHLRGRRGALVLVYLFFVLSLTAKATAVSLPLALLAIDFLERRPLNRRTIVEKLPLFAISIMFGVIGYVAQRAAGASPDLPGFHYGVAAKFALSCRDLLWYLGKTFVPVELSSFYPYPPQLTLADWLAPLFVVVIAAIAFATVRVTRVLAFALAFFFVTIAVTLPLVSIGRTVAADRYTYIPSIGIALAVGVAAQWLFTRARIAAISLTILAIALLLPATVARTAVWHDSVTLWTNVIEFDASLAMPRNARGVAFAQRGDYASATRDFDAALTLAPCYRNAIRNRALIAIRQRDRVSAARLAALYARCTAGK